MVRNLSQRAGHRLQITEDREAAITAACILLNRGIDVTEVAPASGPRGHRLDALAVREIHHLRDYAAARSG